MLIFFIYTFRLPLLSSNSLKVNNNKKKTLVFHTVHYNALMHKFTYSNLKGWSYFLNVILSSQNNIEF